MKRIRSIGRRLVTLVASLALSLSVFAVGPAVSSVAACSYGDYVEVWAYANGGGGKLTVCWGANIGNLTNTAFPQGSIQCPFPHGNDWNDCISSVRLVEPTDTRVCMYNGTNYGDEGVLIESTSGFANGIWNVAPTWDNHISSIKWC